MKTLGKITVLVASLALLLGITGCEKVEEAKSGITDSVTQTIGEAKQAVGIEPVSSQESESSQNEDEEKKDEEKEKEGKEEKKE